LHQVPLAPGKTQHAVKNKNRGRDPKKGKLYRKITKGKRFEAVYRKRMS
jgi:hypothetical protein